MTSEDYEQVDDLNDEAGEYEDFDIDTETGFDDSNEQSEPSDDSDDDSSIIRIEFEDALGNSKEIIIKYK